MPGYAVTVWYGVFAPAGTPAAVVKRMLPREIRAERTSIRSSAKPRARSRDSS